MKKLIVLLCFLTGAVCFISAGLYINKKNAGMDEYVEMPVSKVESPELLSEINMTSYVSLPSSFSDVDIVEDLDNIEVTEENVDDVMYAQLMNTATHLATVEKNDVTLIMDYTITKDGSVKEVESGFKVGYENKSQFYDNNVYKALKGVAVGNPIRLEHVTFNNVEDAAVDLTITNVLDMPYPVTDKYIEKNTEYDSIYSMRAALMNDASGEAKETARQQTISKLIDIMMDQSTFIELPESLIMKELEALQKENKSATYDEAKKNLYKIFFIAAVIDKYDVATKTEIEERYGKLDEETREGFSKYESERMKYLLFEEDVVTYIYKQVQIS